MIDKPDDFLHNWIRRIIRTNQAEIDALADQISEEVLSCTSYNLSHGKIEPEIASAPLSSGYHGRYSQMSLQDVLLLSSMGIKI